MPKNEYAARCHCGNVRFSFLSEEIKNGFRCNCSICIRKGAIWSAYIPSEDFRPTQNEEQLSNYLWNDRVMNHFCCKNCGIHPYAGAPEYGFRVNLGCVEHFDLLALEISLIDGKSMEVCKDPGPYPGSPVTKRNPKGLHGNREI